MASRSNRLLLALAAAAAVGSGAVTYFRGRIGIDAVARGAEGLAAAVEAAPTVARKETAAGREARVSVQRAFVYDGPKEWLEPSAEDHLVAVEIRVHPDSPPLDLDDIEHIDAATHKNYGSFPVVLARTKEGVLTKELSKADEQGALLVIINALPRSVDVVQLGYWGSNLGPSAPIER